MPGLYTGCSEGNSAVSTKVSYSVGKSLKFDVKYAPKDRQSASLKAL